jgi:hypothetical protein
MRGRRVVVVVVVVVVAVKNFQASSGSAGGFERAVGKQEILHYLMI